MAKGLFDLSGKVTVVTGGNSGLGLAFARGIAKQGGDVSIWARNAEKNAAAQAELEAFGVRVGTQQVDVSDEAQIVAGFEAVLKAHGRIDCVIANAGLPPPQTRSMRARFSSPKNSSQPTLRSPDGWNATSSSALTSATTSCPTAVARRRSSPSLSATKSS